MLHDRGGRDRDDLKVTWDAAGLPALATAGESIEGTWSLFVRDVAGRDTGRLNWWGLEIDYDPGQENFEGAAEPNLAIPDNSPAGVESIITVVTAGAASAIVVGVEIKHSYQGDLIVEVEAPSGRARRSTA